MTNETLVRDITNPQEQLISYAGNNVGFYDGFKAGESVLYVYIKSNNDKFTVVRRKAISRKVKDPNTRNMIFVEETKLYARAYARYLEIKKAGGIADPEKVAMAEKIAKLEAEVSNKTKRRAPRKLEEVKEEKEEKSVADLETEALNESK